ncbi:MAG: ATP-dependent DNA helicase UvrD2 [Acidimicrobiia bacterium]
MTDPLLVRLDASQREAVTEAALPLAILAGAGSGKTRVLTHRIAWQSREDHIDPSHVLALTFTRKAAGELVMRLGRLGVRDRVTAGTFHAIALAQLRARQRDRGRPMPTLLDRKVGLLAPMLREAGGPSGAEGTVAAMEVASEIEWAKARLVGPDSYPLVVTAAGREPPRPLSEMTELYRTYEETKRRRRLLDFDDLIIWCGTTLATDQEFRDAQRWRFRHLFVDEFQDVSPAQLQLVKAWLGDRSDLCVVGDPDQAIYGFAGAESGHLTGFAELFPGATVVRLDANYRSTPQVVRAARAVLADGIRQPLPPVRVPHDEGPLPTITTYETDDEEARAIARSLRLAHDAGTPWRRLAVLYRTNAQSATFEAALAATNVPCRVRGAGRFLERPEVKASLEAMRSSVKAAPGTAFTHQLADLAEDAAELPEERREHVDALARLGHEYVNAEGGSGSLDGFLAYLSTALRGEDGPETGDSVELLTFHRAKGLEFDTVWVTGLEQGLVPISFADTPSQRAEERRLLYVACSRAERALHLSWAQERTIGLRVARRRPSPWVSVIHEAIADDPAANRPPVDPRAELAKARAQLQSTSRADPALVAALAEWRSNLARAHDIDPYVIFTNATLDELALAHPSTRSALLAVPGVGPVEVDRYGDAILDLLERHPAPTG